MKWINGQLKGLSPRSTEPYYRKCAKSSLVERTLTGSSPGACCAANGLSIPTQRSEFKNKAPSGLASTKGAFRGFNQEPLHTRLLVPAV